MSVVLLVYQHFTHSKCIFVFDAVGAREMTKAGGKKERNGSFD